MPRAQVLLSVHHALAAYQRCPPDAPALKAPSIGLQLLCHVRCVGWEADARAHVPELPPINRCDAQPTPAGQPIFFIGLEPLLGGTLHRRMQEAPFGPDGQLLAAADLMAGLMGLHSLGIVHADLK